jgi:hypothetical protein
MSLPRDYNDVLRRFANFYAAWFPVAVPYNIGDYGLIQNGVFQKIGNLEDLRDDGFNVEVKTGQGNPVSLDFLSEGAKAIKMVAGAEVPQFPQGAIEAKLTYEFTKKNSFVVKAAEMSVEQMDNLRDVADGLAQLRRKKKWTHRYRVVSSTFTGQSCLVLLASEANTKVEFSGEASALKALNVGSITVKPSIDFSSDAILQSIGKTGVLGLKLFKLRMLGVGVQLLKADGLTDEEREIEESWDTLEDDIQ